MEIDDSLRYASHLSVLRFLLDSLRPERVLEFGSGFYSTPAILNASSVRRLTTVESQLEWREDLLRRYPQEAAVAPRRLFVRATRPDVSRDQFDLILIDDGLEEEERLETLRHVLTSDFPPTVIHDADHPAYATAIGELTVNRFIVAGDPATAVVWQS
jgi:predicted O-methyltransferase YrrM